MGVDTVWQLQLPKAANPFGYGTIADVLLTVEYEALDSPAYRQTVVQALDRRFSGDRSFSLRNDFPDTWYDLNNPDKLDDPAQRMRAAVTLTPADLPPHIADLSAGQLTLFVVRADGFTSELTVTAARRTAAGQITDVGAVTTVGGIAGTRRPGGAPWQTFLGGPAAGRWEFQLDDSPAVRDWFADELITDVVLVFTLDGTTPAWS